MTIQHAHLDDRNPTHLMQDSNHSNVRLPCPCWRTNLQQQRHRSHQQRAAGENPNLERTAVLKTLSLFHILLFTFYFLLFFLLNFCFVILQQKKIEQQFESLSSSFLRGSKSRDHTDLTYQRQERCNGQQWARKWSYEYVFIGAVSCGKDAALNPIQGLVPFKGQLSEFIQLRDRHLTHRKQTRTETKSIPIRAKPSCEHTESIQ